MSKHDEKFVEMINEEGKSAMKAPKKLPKLLLEDEKKYLELKTWLSKGLTIKESLTMTGISDKAYYNYLDRYPEKKEELDRVRNKPAISAKVNIHDAITYDNNLELSKWLLERTQSEIYAQKTQNSNKNETELKIEFNKWTSPDEESNQQIGQKKEENTELLDT